MPSRGSAEGTEPFILITGLLIKAGCQHEVFMAGEDGCK